MRIQPGSGPAFSNGGGGGGGGGGGASFASLLSGYNSKAFLPAGMGINGSNKLASWDSEDDAVTITPFDPMTMMGDGSILFEPDWAGSAVFDISALDLRTSGFTIWVLIKPSGDTTNRLLLDASAHQMRVASSGGNGPSIGNAEYGTPLEDDTWYVVRWCGSPTSGGSGVKALAVNKETQVDATPETSSDVQISSLGHTATTYGFDGQMLAFVCADAAIEDGATHDAVVDELLALVAA